MICHFALIIALLCLEPSHGALTNWANSISQTAAVHNPLVKTQNVKDVELMSEKASQEIHKNYMKSEKRLILLNNDSAIKPFMDENSAHDQERITRALQKLSADQKNEVWIVTATDIGVLDKAYGHIPRLHLAGYEGTQLQGKNSPPGLIQPQLGRINELRAEADRIVADFGFVLPWVSEKQYWIDYPVPLISGTEMYLSRAPLIPSDEMLNEHKVLDMKQKLRTLVGSSEKYKGYGVEVATTPTEYRVVLWDQDYYNKGKLAKDLFKGHEQDKEPIDFGLSIGGMQVDEPMHLAMRERYYHAIFVEGMDNNIFSPWPTHASRRFQDYRESIDLLEKLAGTGNHNNGLRHRVLQSLRGMRQEIERKIYK